jgi:membrane protein YqaA with SNARE-associated domain
MHSDVFESSGITANVIFLIPFSILSCSVLAIQSENLLRGILVSGLKKCYRRLNVVTVAVL